MGELRVPGLALLARLGLVDRAAVVATVRLAVALARTVEAVVAVPLARLDVALAVALAVVDVLGKAARVAAAVLAAVAAVPLARLNKARLVAVLIANPALVAAGSAVLFLAVTAVIVACRYLALLLADAVGDHVLLAALCALVLNDASDLRCIIHADHVLGLVVAVDAHVEDARLELAELHRVALDHLLLGAHVIHHPCGGEVVGLRGGEGEVGIRVAVRRDELNLHRVRRGRNLHFVVVEAILVDKS
mmetsp:Transcript_4681/g.13761  ORF Transcript_4681/g.13761 Transcript_4681/m.13761 type:complete len:248 (+) Transcript_4681:1318-2061(+)